MCGSTHTLNGGQKIVEKTGVFGQERDAFQRYQNSTMLNRGKNIRSQKTFLIEVVIDFDDF